MEVATLLDMAARRLAEALPLEAGAARGEARILASHAMGVSRAWLVGHDRDDVGPEGCAAVEQLLRQRELGTPVAYILGAKEFYGRRFRVTADVLIPRPETELLVDAALERIAPGAPARILDLGTGSGCLAATLALERPAATVHAVEQSEAALELARFNAHALGARVSFTASDWYASLAGRRFDLIVANPPYIADGDPHLARGDVRFEPDSCLVSGESGLEDLIRIIGAAPSYLSPGGWLLVEHGWNQGASCKALFLDANFHEIETLRDLGGNERVTLGRQSG